MCEDLELGGVKQATWGHQELDAGTLMIIEKVGGNCNISHFPLEYVLVKETLHPTLLVLQYSNSCLAGHFDWSFLDANIL